METSGVNPGGPAASGQGYRETLLHPIFGRVLAAAVWALCALTLGTAIATVNVAAVVHGAAPLAFLAFAMWAMFWRPGVRIGPAAVSFVNVLSTVTVAWPAIVEVQTRWSLTLVTRSRAIASWAAPRPSIGSGRRPTRMQIIALNRPEARAERSPLTSITAVSEALIRDQLERYQNSGRLRGVESGTGITTQWHIASNLAFAVLAALTIVSAVVR